MSEPVLHELPETVRRMTLGEAVRRFVAPGMTLHLAGGIGGPSAVICELIRRFAGRGERFTFVQSTLAGHALNLVHCGLVKRLVCAVCAEIGTSARPSRVVQQALESGRIEMENWSLLSLQQRLMAAAFGVPFLPTRSLLGSSVADEQKERFRELDDPFGSGERVGLVQALVPDLSFVHGCLADEEGNTVLAAPVGDDLWGALASRDGVVVTVERIVPTGTLRRHAALVRIPGHRVRAVCEAPLGLHPFSLADPGVGSFAPYEKDFAFLDAAREASRSSAALDDWIERWVLRPGSHDAYLEALGSERVAALRARAASVAPIFPADTRAHGQAAASASDAPATENETMQVVLAREIVASVRRSRHRVVLAGAGVGAQAAFLAQALLVDDGVAIDLVTGNGQIGYAPVPGESILATQAGVSSTKMLSDTVTTQGVVVGGGQNRCLSVLGAGQIDRFGNLNSTRTASGRFLVGSGGANDALNAAESIVVLNLSPERFVDTLAYCTGPGTRVRTVVTTGGVLRKHAASGDLELAAVFAGNGTIGERAQRIRELCGWPLRVAEHAGEIDAPSDTELRKLRWLNGDGAIPRGNE